MFIPDVAATALTSPAQQQTVQKIDQVEVQQASISSHSRAAVEVAPTAVTAAAQAETSKDRATDQNNQEADQDGQNQNNQGQNGNNLTEEIRQKLEDMASESFGSENTRLSILFDEETDSFVYQTRDAETGEVVRQYPSEEVINQLGKIRDVRGLAFEEVV